MSFKTPGREEGRIVPCLAEQPWQDGSCGTRESLSSGHQLEGWGRDGRENCPASTGTLTLLQEEQEGQDAKGTTNQWHVAVGAAGTCRDHGTRAAGGPGAGEWLQHGGQPRRGEQKDL